MASIPAGISAPSGNQGSRGDHRAFADARAIQNDGSDADQHLIFNRAAVQHRHMPHRDAIADDGRIFRVGVHHSAVLNAGFVPDLDQRDVAAQRRRRPDAGALTDGNVSNNGRVWIDIGGGGDTGPNTAKTAKHK